jgi:hypothetical protein
MRPAQIAGGLAVLLTLGGTVRAQSAPYEARIGVPEVEVRSGKSREFYPTSKLRQGDRVKVLREEEDGWLAIEPPPGSFSWVNARFIERDSTGRSAVVKGVDVPVRIGSSLANKPPDVQQVKLQPGTQLVILGESMVGADGRWWPITPPPSEVRYIPKDAVQATPPVQTVAAAHPGAGAPGTAPGGGTDSLVAQAEQAERAGNRAEAIRLYEEASRQASAIDHAAAMRYANMAQFLRSNNRGSVPAGYQPGRPSEAAFTGYNRPVPAPAYPYQQPPQTAYSAGQAANYNQSQSNVLAPRWTGPGWLRRSGMNVDGRPTYALETSGGQLLYYVTPLPGVNLDSYVNRSVNLYGTVVYRGDLRGANYMTVTNVTPLQ